MAAAAKLTDRPGTKKAAVGFGASEWLALPIAVLLPIAELTVAVLLLIPATAVVGAIGAFVLLGVFSGAISLSLLRGNAPDCHCFGQLHSAPTSWKTLVQKRRAHDRPVVAKVGLVGHAELLRLGLDERFTRLLREREAELRLVSREREVHDPPDAELHPASDERLRRARQAARD